MKNTKLQQLGERKRALLQALGQWNQHRELAAMTVEDYAAEVGRLSEKVSQKVSR